MKKLISIFTVFFYLTSLAQATIYYVRPLGGTATQCTGTTNADYPGSGTGQACAFNHPFWLTGVDANCGNTSGAMSAGDTGIIKQKTGGYDMGYGAPNTSGSTSFPWDCHMKPIVSGSDSSHKTKIYGENYASCGSISSATELYGKERSYWVIDMNSSSHIDLRCLNITDHAQCRYNDPTGDGYNCPTSYPYGDFAQRGVKSSSSSDVYMQDIWVHGMAAEGWAINNPSDWDLENVNSWGNSTINMNFNGSGASGTTDQATGTMTLNYGVNAWSGCLEAYPVTSSSYSGLTLYDPKTCCSQDQGCPADGLGTNSNGADWVINHQVYIHNVADGLDLLYHDTGSGTVTVQNSAFIDNSGNQLKASGSVFAYNNVIKGDCNYFSGKSFTYTGDGGFSDHCRAGGDAVAATFQLNTDIAWYGNTVYDVKGNDAFTIAGRGVTAGALNNLDIQNSIFQSPSTAGFMNVDSTATLATVTQTTSVIYGFTTNPSGSGNAFTNPSFTSGTVLGMTLGVYLSSTSSPAYNIANESASGQPSTDITGYARGANWDTGAVEFRAVATNKSVMGTVVDN